MTWRYEMLPDLFREDETGIVIHAEDMPAELTP